MAVSVLSPIGRGSGVTAFSDSTVTCDHPFTVTVLVCLGTSERAATADRWAVAWDAPHASALPYSYTRYVTAFSYTRARRPVCSHAKASTVHKVKAFDALSRVGETGRDVGGAGARAVQLRAVMSGH